jgi:hypothetical protein
MTSNSSSNDTTKASTTMSAEQVAQNIKDIARRIREQSARMRERV